MNPLQNYKRTRILTASSGELLVMLYDGLLQRIRQGSKHMASGRPGPAGEVLGKAQDILHELMSMLDREKAPELADNLMGLYQYSARLCIEAIGAQDASKLDEVYDLLKPLRDAWAEAEKTLRKDRTGTDG